MVPKGLKGIAETLVTKDMLASHIGSGEADVYATPMMAALIEKAAWESIKPYLPEGKTSVGISLHIAHTVATPLGMRVAAISEVTDVSVDGRIITFAVTAQDDQGIIGDGTHVRAVVDQARFQQKTDAKNENAMQEKERPGR